MPRTTINSWHAAYMAVDRAHGGYRSSLLLLIVKRCAACQAWMCLSHPWQLRSDHHQNHMEELTFELSVSHCVIRSTPGLLCRMADHQAATAVAAEGRVGKSCGRSSFL